MPLVAPRFN
ncbi:hypothetical protein VTL71DRAFT_11488 [Oculimacula yallundae]|uniref:Uncharacterized protein n=1 Tax=Oculimacula yallundae TaxID=86028 RepID=A0ABR4CQN2_9HELO